MDWLEELRKFLLERAEAAGTLAAVARQAGVHPVTLWRIAQGQREPSGGTLIRLCRAFPALGRQLLLEAASDGGCVNGNGQD